MTARAASAEATRERIIDAAAQLLKTRFRSEIRLEDVAALAAVTVPTVINNFATKANLLDVALKEVIRRISAVRRRAEPGDIRGAIKGLYQHYDSVGDWVMRNIMEEADPELLALGRARHREWVELYFGPRLAGLTRTARKRRIDALIAACDVYMWRLLRRDMGRSRAEAEGVVLLMVESVLGARP